MEHYFNLLAEWFKGLPGIVQVLIIIVVIGVASFYRMKEILEQASKQCKSDNHL